ncbi:MAG TPA: tol-pal system protein YbgF, partial [Stellaceae bacterium]|nr:tol-pal system protein YbgF [Stellaceae bacterium]
VRPSASVRQARGLTLSSAPALAPPALAQERLPYERLDRLERDLNMLKRHIYQGASVPVYAPDGAAAVNAQLRMDRLEAEMRDLTGRVEEYANRLEQMRRRVEQLNGNAESRFGHTSGPGPQGPVAAAMPPPRSARPPGSYEDEPGGPTPILGTLTPPGTPPGSPPRSNQPASAASPPQAADAVLPGGSATEKYNYAFGLMKDANYPAAEAAFKEFVEAHPKDQMAGNAQYWLGETYFARGKYREAASAFAEVYKRYPKSLKAPDALLKLGMSLAGADQKQNACVALAKLGEEFPKAAASVRQRGASEMKKLGC